MAVLLLVLRPEGLVGLAVALPAVITLTATAARMVIALRESNAAGEAFQLARTDDLTGLPNRRALLRAVDGALGGREPFALMLIGLDGFKEVNDTLGHSAGDTLLELVALRLRSSLPPGTMLARVGGDEFAILATNQDEIELLERAQSVRGTLLAPARIEGLDLGMSASIGIAIRQLEDMRAADLLRRADVAMFEAKVNRTGAELYRPDHDEFSRMRLQMGEDLRRALRAGQVTVWFQPKVGSTGKAVGMEALVRWERPNGEVRQPAEFLPVARRAGLMGELSEVVLDRAVTAAARWHRMGLDLHVALNLAPPELLTGEQLRILYAAIANAGLPAHHITIEVTEDSFLVDPVRARQVLLEVKQQGLRIAIDDYGTGFSSLSYLRDLPIDELKLDRSFVSTVSDDERSRLIVSSTVTMAHALGLLVVAEGVEDARVASTVLSLGADVLQGYHFAKPMREAQVDEWVRAANAPPPPFHVFSTAPSPRSTGRARGAN
jgi:diguanylate cyclase (GGDEF)-like protein